MKKLILLLIMLLALTGCGFEMYGAYNEPLMYYSHPVYYTPYYYNPIIYYPHPYYQGPRRR